MMSRASRMLKWVGAVTVLLAAAPIAYADSAPASEPPSNPPAQASAWCGGGPEDYAGDYLVAGLADAAYHFDPSSMRVLQLYLGAPPAPGTWQAGGGTISWTVGGVTYTSVPGSSACADPSAASTVTEFTAATADGSDTVTLQRR
jgi:hypothetical protein